MKKNLILILVLILAGVTVLFYQNQTPEGKIEIKIGEATNLADVADTSALREQGLSGRKSLSDGEGMLFIFDELSQPGFWMKDMNFPIDIVWISAQKRVVGIEPNVSPGSYPQIFRPKELILYVLELRAGGAAKMHIDIGTEVNFNR